MQITTRKISQEIPNVRAKENRLVCLGKYYQFKIEKTCNKFGYFIYLDVALYFTQLFNQT